LSSLFGIFFLRVSLDGFVMAVRRWVQVRDYTMLGSNCVCGFHFNASRRQMFGFRLPKGQSCRMCIRIKLLLHASTIKISTSGVRVTAESIVSLMVRAVMRAMMRVVLG